MALTKISELGGKVIQGDEQDELIIPAKGDGTAKPGWLVGLTAAGVIAGTDEDGVDEFVGIVLPSHETDVDAVITSGANCSVVVPRSGHLYAFFVEDLNSSIPGNAVIFSGTAGSAGPLATIESSNAIAYAYRYTDGDTVGIFMWR
jgi:hypothetical protein